MLRDASDVVREAVTAITNLSAENAAMVNKLRIAGVALSSIANGDGIYGAQAAEYKAIARKAIEDMRR